MGNFISLRPCDADIPGYLRLIVTKGAYQQMTAALSSPLGFLTTLSQSDTLLGIWNQKEVMIKFNTPAGTCNCRMGDDGLKITAFKKTSLNEQNAAMKHGISFHITRGLIVSLRLQAPYDIFMDLSGGRQYDTNYFAGTNTLSAARQIFDVAAARAAERHAAAEETDIAPDEEPGAYTPDWQLEELLDVAEHYANLASDLEKQKATDHGKQEYNGIRAADYARVDRIAYEFGVEGLDETVFKEGAQVELEDREGQTHTAEILKLVKEDADSPATAMVLLFNKQISLNTFQSSGFFSLSFSTVNRDVQLEAIEKIRTGKAKSAYMDAVLGRNEPAGFDHKDMAPVDRSLALREHPLNPAQRKAVYAGINSRDVLLVMGPPGTGKTTVIQEWVRYFVVQEGKRVLVSSQNHKAVDNVFTRLAEDAGIEMIRIGSESNLQSDVIPYMFENKIAALRQRIEGGTDTHIENIGRIIKVWQDYALGLEEAAAMEADATIMKNAFIRAVQDLLMPLYSSLREQLEDHQQLRRRMEKVVTDMEKLAAKLRRHETATNFLMRLLTGIFYKFRLKRLRSLPDKLEEMRFEEQELIRTYQENYARYRQQKEQIKNSQYLAWLRLRERLEETMVKLGTRPEWDAKEDLWDLFAESRRMKLNHTGDIPLLKKQLEADTARAVELRNVLGNWRRDMAGKQNYALGDIVLESVSLVGATCIGINSQKRFADLDFDVTIIDEAGQIQIHNALVPMSVSGKVILLGDYQQIPPQQDPALEALCEEQDPPVDTTLLNMSLFEKMYQTLPEENKIMLDTQYRIPSQIADTVSEWFYDNQYLSFDNKKGMRGALPWLSDSPFVVIDTSGCAGRFEKAEGKSFYNELEAHIAQVLMHHMIANGDMDTLDVGIISAHKPQAKRIRRKLTRAFPNHAMGEAVATLDSYQGQERDIIIFSFTRSSAMPPHIARIGFLRELRRLNVAMTRSKKTLVLIGDMAFLSTCQCTTDREGNPIIHSEKEFSAFITKMLKDVDSGRGHRIPYAQFKQKLEGGDN